MAKVSQRHAPAFSCYSLVKNEWLRPEEFKFEVTKNKINVSFVYMPI